jgi:hypothetical protein
MHVTGTTTTEITVTFTGHTVTASIGCAEWVGYETTVEDIALDRVEILGETFTPDELPPRLRALIETLKNEPEYQE